MKIERTKNATRNMIFGTIQKVYSLAIPFLMRTLMIYFMGVQYLGLNSLFTSILQVLNLTELGVGSAMVFSMYGSIASDNTDRICKLMRLYKIYYRIIGLVIAVIGSILIPFIPMLINKNSLETLPNDINIYLIYILNLSATVLTYWLFAYKNCLFQAHQRDDITKKVLLITNTIQYALQILAICLFRNYYIYCVVALFTQTLTNLSTAFLANKFYPKYKAVGKLPKEDIKSINHRIRDLFTSKIGNVAVNSADTIVISAFLGLTTLAIYQNYFYIITALTGLIQIILNACTAGIGNSLIVETREKNFKDFKTFAFILAWIVGFCTVCLLCLYQPFIIIWVGEELMLNFTAVIYFCIYFFVQEFNSLFILYKDSGGIWHKDRWRTLITALANLIMNLIIVQFWGVYGVLASTFLATMLIGMPWLLHNLFTTMFEKKYLKSFCKHLLYYSAITIIVSILTYLVCFFINITNTWILFIVRLVICLILPNLLFFIAYRWNKEYVLAMKLLDRITNKKIKSLRKYREKE